MKRDFLNSPRLLEIQKRRHKIFFRQMLFWFIGFAIIFFALVQISKLDKLNIREINIIGNKIIDTEMIKQVVDDELAGKYLWLFPRTNLFFYPKNDIENALTEKFKRLKNINFSIRDNKILEISVEERRAEYVWCGETPTDAELPSSNKCYFLDSSGYIFDEAPYFSGEVYFKFYGLTNTFSSSGPIGTFFQETNFNQVISFIDTLKSINIKPVALYVMPSGDAKIYLDRAKASTLQPEILFKVESDFQKLIENLQSALLVEPLLSDFKNKYASLLYIDLRFGNKVYYKFR